MIISFATLHLLRASFLLNIRLQEELLLRHEQLHRDRIEIIRHAGSPPAGTDRSRDYHTVHGSPSPLPSDLLHLSSAHPSLAQTELSFDLLYPELACFIV